MPTNESDSDIPEAAEQVADDAAEQVADDAAGARPGRVGLTGRRKTIVVAVLGIVSVLLLHSAIVGLWTIRTVTDSERFEEQIEETLQSEEVSAALARVVLDEVGEAVDLRGELVAIAPESVEPLIDVLLAGLQSRLEDRLAELIREPAVSSNVAAVAGAAHELAIKVLEGEKLSDRVLVDDDQVRVNLVPLAARALALLPDLGVLSDVEIPQFEPGGDPAEQVAELEEALGVDLRDDFAQPVIFTSESLARAGDTVDLLRSALLLIKRAFWLLLLVGVSFFAMTIWLSNRRRYTATVLVGALTGVALLTWFTTWTISDRVSDSVAGAGARATVREVVGGLHADLTRTLLVSSLLAIVGLTLAVVWGDRVAEKKLVTTEAEPADRV